MRTLRKEEFGLKWCMQDKGVYLLFLICSKARDRGEEELGWNTYIESDKRAER